MFGRLSKSIRTLVRSNEALEAVIPAVMLMESVVPRLLAVCKGRASQAFRPFLAARSRGLQTSGDGASSWGWAFQRPWPGWVPACLPVSAPVANRALPGWRARGWRVPNGGFHLCDHLGCWHLQHFSKFQQDNDIGALDAPLHHADKRPVKLGGGGKLLLGHPLSLPAFAQDAPEGPLWAVRRLNLRAVFPNPLPGSQTNILGCTLLDRKSVV